MLYNLSFPWIISKRADLRWLIGSVGFSLLAIVLYYAIINLLNTNVNTTIFFFYLAWVLLFDSSHFFATYTRTYFDKPFFATNKPILLMSFLLFLIGPLFIGLPFLFSKDVFLLRNTLTIFNRFCVCYAYFHIIRQHWGIVALYRRKNNETDLYTRRLDHWILLTGCFLPLVYFQYDAMPLLGKSEIMNGMLIQSWNAELLYVLICAAIMLVLHILLRKRWAFLRLHIVAAIFAGIALFIFLAREIGLKYLLGWMCSLLFLTFVILVLLYLFRHTSFAHTDARPVNVPKWTLMCTVILAHIIFIALPFPLLLKPVLIGIFHNLQYHRLVYYHNQNKYGAADRAAYGMAVVFTKNLFILAVCTLLFALVEVAFQWGSRRLFVSDVQGYFIAALAWGIPLHHYFLDAVIWRLKKDTSLAAHLKLGG
jgi:hypothetical protein